MRAEFYLVGPLSRLSRYNLILTEMCKHADDGSLRKGQLGRVVQGLRNVTNWILKHPLP